MTDSMYRRKALTAALAFFITTGALRAGVSSAAARAEKLYKQGNLAGAVAEAEAEYSKTGDSGLKTSLIKYLTELGLDMSFKENYSAASYAFSRALVLSPDDETLKDLAATSKDLSSYTSPPPTSIPKKKVTRTSPPPRKTPAGSAYIKQQRALILKLGKLAEAIEKQSAQPSGIPAGTVKKLDKLIRAGENAADSINTAVSKTGANIKRTFVITAVAMTASIAALIGAAFLITRYAVNRYHTLNFSIKNLTPGMGLRKRARRIPLITPAEDTKYEGIDIIEAELSSEDSTEAGVAKKLLEPFLNDTDIELKSRAINALHKYSGEEACKLLEQEALKGEAGIKIFCWLIQLLDPEKSVAIAEKLMKKTKPHEKSLIAGALLKINTPDLDKKLREKINSLAEISGSDDWVVS